MNEEPAPPDVEAVTETLEAEPVVTPAPAPKSATARPPKWLPFFLIAVVPALIVGLAVYFFAGGDSAPSGGGASNGAGVLDGFFRLGPGSDGDVTSYKGKLPPAFPKEFPVMSGNSIVGSFEVLSADGTNYFIVLSGSSTPDKIYDYYLAALDKDPWQIEIARASADFTGVRFSRPDNPDVQGDVTVHHSDLDNKTVTYVSFEDISKKQSNSKKPADAFVLPASRALPPGFPNDVPIYKGTSAPSVVSGTYFERGQGGKNFIVSLLTKDSEDDVLKFYKGEFGKKGWTVTDGSSSSTSGASRFAMSIDFSDGSKGEISGSVRADQFDKDPSYNKIDLLVQLSGRRSRGN